MLVFYLSSNRAQFFLFSHDSLLKFSSNTLQISHSLLGKLQVSFNLSLEFFNITLGFLLTLKSILTLIQRLLKLPFNLAKMVAPILHGLNVFLCFLTAFTSTLLLFSKLANQFFLMRYFLSHGSNLIIFSILIFFCFFTLRFKCFNFFPQTICIRTNLDTGLIDAIDKIFFIFNSLFCVIHLFLEIIFLTFKAISFINNLLHCRSARGEG